MSQKLPIDLTMKGRTKEEIARRKQEEDATLTGIPLEEWNETMYDDVAHAEFERIKNLLDIINRNDALYTNIVNTYCLLFKEVKGHLLMLDECYKKSMTDSKLETTLNNKRKLMLELEKQLYLTPASGIKNAPKLDKKDSGSKMANFMKNRGK